MQLTSFDIWSGSLIIVTIIVAVITDVRSRRIPNLLTFPALGLGLIARIAFQGWTGLALALAGMLIAPLILVLLHGGKGLGAGDIKLAAALGVSLGPISAVVGMLATALAGGVLGLVYMLRSGGILTELSKTLLVGLPLVGKLANRPMGDPKALAPLTMPYGVAIGAGTLLTMAVRWWTGSEVWFL